MVKPTMTKEVAIHLVIESRRTIYFFSTDDAVDDFVEYGCLQKSYKQNYWVLEVDGRFDFDEVVTYIENYDSQNSVPLI